MIGSRIVGMGLVLAGAGAMYAYNNKNNSSDSSSSNDSSQNSHQEYLKKIEYLPFFIATMFSIANVDGIHKTEEKVIAEFLKEFEIEVKSLNCNELDNTLNKIKEPLLEIENNKNTIMFSEAIKYFPYLEKEDLDDDIKKTLNNILITIINADSITTQEEDKIAEHIKLFIKKGKRALPEIKKSEQELLLKKYYLIENDKNFTPKELLPNTEIITRDNLNFLNIQSLDSNAFYIEHPMIKNILWSPLNISQLEDLILDEWVMISEMLGAKSIKIMTEENFSQNKSNIYETNAELSSEYKSYQGEIKGNTNSSKENSITNKKTRKYERTFETGNKEPKEKVSNELVWLKNNSLLKGLIKSRYSKNPSSSFSDMISGENYLSENHEFSYEATLKARIAILEFNGEFISNKSQKQNTFRSFKRHLDIEF